MRVWISAADGIYTLSKDVHAEMVKNRWVALLVAIVGAAIVLALFQFNKQSHSYEEYLVTNIAALFWLPMVLILVVTVQEPTSFGFALGDAGKGYRLAGLFFAVMLPVLFIASKMPQFQSYYPIQKLAANDLAYFGYFELTYGMYLFCWEFFFRGFLLFGLSRTIGSWSVFIQAIAFGIMHLGKPAPEVAASFAAGIILGVLALRVKSFAPGFLLHWACALTFDVFIIMAVPGGII